MLYRSSIVLLAMVVLGFAAASAGAQTTFTFDTPVGATSGGEPVDASATFVVSGDTVTITLTNLEANPTSIAQALSGIDFDVSSGSEWAFLSSSSGERVRILRDHDYILGSTGATGWRLNETYNGGFQLAAADFRGGDTLLIGPPAGSSYSNANRSITGHRHHDQFLDQTATFVLTIPCLKGMPTITEVSFLFGNDRSRDCMRGNRVPGDPAVTPEPTTMLLFGSGLAAIGAAFRRKIRSLA